MTVVTRVGLSAGAAALVIGFLSGCVRRTISITSDPAGALVILNDREVGRTPVEVDFTYYGTYDVRLLKDGYEPFVGSAEAKSPAWDTIPLDLMSELVPADLHARVAWHFIMAPSQAGDVLERATEMRKAVEQESDGESDGDSAPGSAGNAGPAAEAASASPPN